MDFGQVILVAAAWVLIASILLYPTRWVQDENRQTGFQVAVVFWPVGIPCLAVYALMKIADKASRPMGRGLVGLAKKIDRSIWSLTKKKIDESEFGILWEGRMPYGRHIEVEVGDSTGKYFIPVDPDRVMDSYKDDEYVGQKVITTSREAVAWTYGFDNINKFNPVMRA